MAHVISKDDTAGVPAELLAQMRNGPYWAVMEVVAHALAYDVTPEYLDHAARQFEDTLRGLVLCEPSSRHCNC